MMRWLRLVTRYWPYWLVGIAFVASRWVYRNVLGVEFDTEPVTFYIQYIDPWFVEHDFARSLLYLHHQAPFQNLLVGAAIRCLGQARGFQALEALYTCFAFGTALGLLHVCLRLRVQRWIASALSLLYAISSTTVVYENWLLYHVPVAFFLVLSLAALVHYYRERSFGAALLFFSLIAVVALFRSTFGPLFLLAAFGLLWLRAPLEQRQAARRILLKAVAIPLALLILNSAKPWLLIRHSYGETFLWGNLKDKVVSALPAAEVAALQAEGKISRAATIFCLGDLKKFGDLRIPHLKTGVPLLDMERAPNGRWNAHALEYLLLTEKYQRPDTLYLLSHYPWVYLKSVRRALGDYAGSSLDDSMLPGSPNYLRVHRASELIDGVYGLREDKSFTLLRFGLPLLLVYALLRLIRRGASSGSQRCSVTVSSYALLTALYVASVSVLISSGDFGRYRFEVDPFHIFLLALLLSDLWRVIAFGTRAALRWLSAASEASKQLLGGSRGSNLRA
jgi:hypothetical protein